MVKICDLIYPAENEKINKEYFDQYSYKHELHDFQKWSIEATINGHHVLACAPTGAGKSLCAEFAIDFFWKKGKKSIYCSPIKSLSNQKYYDFQRKFPSISIGLITGDIKINPLANVLIMTTEILLSTFLNLADLGCVIFDEIHMIGDKDRGHVWESCILQLPPCVQIIGLSATLDNPERFARWIETRGVASESLLTQVYLTRKLIRPVPLTHYSFITVNSGIFKAIKDKDIHQQIKSIIDQPFIIQDDKGVFNEQTFLNMNNMLTLFSGNNVRVKRQHVLNQVSKFLVEKEMLPALCFVFSISKLEKCAEELTCPLLEFDSKVPYTIAYECEQIMRRLPNYQEYLLLPEYLKLVALLQKGIGIHHSKMMPVLREIVELLFAKGLIKMLFCTTSVAIGLNLPVKTSIFTDIYKHNGTEVCILEGHEYVQAAGRAGRLGIDPVGSVIHLNNLFLKTGVISYKTMLKGAPQKLVSNFKISYNLLLNSIATGEKDLDLSALVKRSMIQYEIGGEVAGLKGDIDRVTKKCGFIEQKVPKHVLEEYVLLKGKLPTLVNKKRKECERAVAALEDTYKNIVKEVETYKKSLENALELSKLTNKLTEVENMLDADVATVLNVLLLDKFVERQEIQGTPLTKYNLSIKGHAATHFKEVPCLIFASLILDKKFDGFLPKEIAGFLSCFANVKVMDDLRSFIPVSTNKTSEKVCNLVKEVHDTCSDFVDLEIKGRMNTGTDYSMQFDLINYIILWADCSSEPECKLLLKQMSEDKGIFLGEFVKAILKIVAIVAELAITAELINDLELLQSLKNIPLILLKFVATNQSLYV